MDSAAANRSRNRRTVAPCISHRSFRWPCARARPDRPETIRRPAIWTACLRAAELQPSSRESGAPESLDERSASLHQLPEQAGAVVLDHQHEGPLVQPPDPGGHPAVRTRGPFGKGPVEGGLETVLLPLLQADFLYEVADRGQNDLGGERQSRGDR